MTPAEVALIVAMVGLLGKAIFDLRRQLQAPPPLPNGYPAKIATLEIRMTVMEAELRLLRDRGHTHGNLITRLQTMVEVLGDGHGRREP